MLNKGGCNNKKNHAERGDGFITFSNLKYYENTPIKIDGIKDKVTVKIPIILSEKNINFSLNYTFYLPEDIYYIEHIKNNLIIDKIIHLKNDNNLFITGKIRKIIHYVPKISPYVNNVKYFIVYIPFEINTAIDLDKGILQASEVYFQPISSKIIDKITLDFKFIKNFMEVILKIDALQEQYISLMDFYTKDNLIENFKKEDRNSNEKEIIQNKINPSPSKNRGWFLTPIKDSIKNKSLDRTLLLLLFVIFLIKSNLY